jgi:hypothetical protein
MDNYICPEQIHFHVVFEAVDSFDRPSKTIISKTPLEALSIFIPTLEPNWKGSISVFDDSNGHEDEMPLLHHIIS